MQDDPKVLICIGSGGVGKTTVSASLAVKAALEGKKVFVLTVDPSRRLATTFQLNQDGSEQKIDINGAHGELWASVLNSKNTFDDFVRKAGAKGIQIDKLLNNQLYQQLSQTLSGSQEFTALEKLYSTYESGRYDLIILDTPPTQHALDFLSAPRKISTLFDDSITKWFRTDQSHGFFQQILQTGTKRALQALKLLTGSDFFNQLGEFFSSIEAWQTQLKERTQKTQDLLFDSRTHFNLITAFDSAKLREAEAFANELTARGFHLKYLTINRAFPNWLPKPFKNQSPLNDFCIELNKYYDNKLNSIFATKNMMNDLELLLLPEYDRDIADLDGLITLVKDYQWKKRNAISVDH